MENNNQIPSASVLEGPVRLFSFAWNLFRTNWRILVGITIFPIIILYVGNLLGIISGHNAALGILGGIISLAGAVFAIAMQGASIDAVNKLAINPGAEVRFWPEYKFGFSIFWSIVLLIIIQGFVFLGSFVLLIIPAIIIAVYSGMYLFARVLDGKKGFAAFTEAYSVVKGRWWGVLGRILFLVLVYAVGALILSGLIYLLQALFGTPSDSAGGLIIGMILNGVYSAILSPIALVYIYKLYTSLRATRVAGVQTVAYKRWLIAFLCVGVVAIVVIPIVAGSLLISYLLLPNIQNGQIQINGQNINIRGDSALSGQDVILIDIGSSTPIKVE